MYIDFKIIYFIILLLKYSLIQVINMEKYFLNEKLSKSVEKYWWKHWILEYLKELDWFKDYILDYVLLNIEWISNKNDIGKINSFNWNSVIIRTSEYSDYEWMIDVMPTIICTRDKITNTLSEIKKICKDESIIEYSKNEWWSYNSDNVSISISPYIEWVNFTLTEHPNQENSLLLDIYNESTDEYSNRKLQIIDIYWDDIIWLSDIWIVSNREQLSPIIDLMNKLKIQKLFNDDRAIQIEWGINFINNSINLYQVRDFWEKKLSSFSLEENSFKTYSNRVIWLTPEEWIILPISKDNFRNSSISSWDFSYKKYLLSPENITSKLKIHEYSDKIYWYIPWWVYSSKSLVHQNTRFVKEVLRNEWVSILWMEYLLEDYSNWDYIRIISDWRNFDIKKI